MKKTLIAALVPFALLGASPAFADTQGCAAKISAIEAQLASAKAYGNTNKVAGLQDALEQTKARCTDAGQLARAEAKVRDKQGDVSRVQEEVRQAEQSLRDAQAKGDAKKIAKAQDKLRDKQDKLREKMADLREAQADLEALKA